MEEILHQLRLINLSHDLQGFIHPRWLAGFLNHQQYVFKPLMCPSSWNRLHALRQYPAGWGFGLLSAFTTRTCDNIYKYVDNLNILELESRCYNM